MPLRPLYPSELAIAAKVFVTSVPFLRTYISPFIGLENRPFTTTVPPLVPMPRLPVPWVRKTHELPCAYVINIGADGFLHGMDQTPKSQRTLIHELTHVWQGANMLLNTGYMWESIMHQGYGWLTSTDPYAYELGRSSFFFYNVEAQAHIVEDWFANGMNDDDPRFPYIQTVRRFSLPI
jgi:hypothetical protein